MNPPSAGDYLHMNRALWNARVPVHVGSRSYDVAGFLRNPCCLTEIEREMLGEVRGRSALHLQCHFGMDTISLATLGARAVGLDFSEVAIAEARRLAAATGAAATFVCADVYETRKVVREQFDLVFSSFGAIGWLPELTTWAGVVADSLRPGGRFVFAEFHPMLMTFADDFSEIQYSYFNREAIVEETAGTYADPAAVIDLPSVGWNHPLAEVLGALLAAGLRLTRFQEDDYSPFGCFRNMVETAPGRHMIRGREGKLPMFYALEAVKG
jgi:SAM-dependent methyltransferase